MKIGTHYYPEQWPREQWERDFDSIVAMDLQVVHMGEFAWCAMEPREGQIQLDWLSECVEMAARRKLSVILCTPTAALPVWLMEKHPDVLPRDDVGRTRRLGGRNSAPTSPHLHEATRRIVTALAERFGGRENIIGWQIDNEYSSDFFDQNEHAVAAFHHWLEQRYGTIEALNRAWGRQYWNTCYSGFAQVELPPGRDPAHGNPHQRLDASRFWSWAFARFNKLQADILREKVISSRPSAGGGRPGAGADAGGPVAAAPAPFITTNFISFHPDVNPADLAGDFNLMAWDSYPCAGLENAPRDQCFRLGDPSSIGLMHDYMASFHGRWGLMELQPGQVNFGSAPVLLYPGAVRLWIWTALAHGAEFTTTYRFRQPHFGAELFHHGLVGPDGTTPTTGGREFQQTIDEVDRLDFSAMPPIGAPAGVSSAAPDDESVSATSSASPNPGAVGLVFDFEQLWSFESLPQGRRWDYVKLLRLWYGALMRLGLDVRVLRPGAAWPGALRMIIIPALQMVSEEDVRQMTQFAAGGGHLVLTCRTALMDRNGQLFEGPLGKPIVSLIGGMVEAYDGLPEGSTAKVELDDKEYEWGIWGDLLYSEEDTKILAKYADQFYEGAAAVIQNRYEQGVVTYCGVFGEQDFTDALAAKLAAGAGLAVKPLPPRVQLLRRGPYRFLLNYSLSTVEVPAPPRTKFIVGTRKLEPAGVAVWKE